MLTDDTWVASSYIQANIDQLLAQVLTQNFDITTKHW